MPSKKYPLPNFLAGKCTEAEYLRWLSRKARTHVRRDKDRGNGKVVGEDYKIAIHCAVVESDGRDAYTGLLLRWDLISKYDNDLAKQNTRNYKKGFGDLPTVDHVNDGKGPPDFKICSWRVNDSKNDLSIEEFIELCRLILLHNRK